MEITEIKEKLYSMQDLEYKQFSSSLLPNTSNLIGVRIPLLRNLAKEINKENPTFYLAKNTFDTFEETMLQGMVIGLQKDIHATIYYTKQFIPKINNWSICDSFCTSLKITKKYPQTMWKFIVPYFKEKDEFAVRFALVMSLLYFINDDYIDVILENIAKIKKEEYYVSMAIAWFLSIAYKTYPDKVLSYLKNKHLSTFVRKKTIQKIKELQKTTKDTKQELENFLKNIKN